MLVNFEVRLRLFNSDNECLMLVRGNEYERSGNKVLIPTGGGMLASRDDKKYMKNYFQVKLAEDLRFEVKKPHQKALLSFFNSMSKDRILKEAAREFRQELGSKERNFLSEKELSSCKLIFRKKITPPFEAESYRNATKGQPMLYFVGLVDVNAPKPIADRLTEIIDKEEDPMLEFVPLNTIANGRNSARGSAIPPIYHYFNHPI